MSPPSNASPSSVPASSASASSASASSASAAKTPPANAKQVLDREFLEMRCKILEVAAAFDRLDRASGSVQVDPRLSGLHEALRVLLDGSPDRAERVQLIFSRRYEPTWRDTFGLAGPRPTS